MSETAGAINTRPLSGLADRCALRTARTRFRTLTGTLQRCTSSNKRRGASETANLRQFSHRRFFLQNFLDQTDVVVRLLCVEVGNILSRKRLMPQDNCAPLISRLASTKGVFEPSRQQ